MIASNSMGVNRPRPTWRRRGQITGRADYFVMIGGRWIPIEAKLNLLTESNLLGQIGKYLRVDKFVATVRKRQGSEFFPQQHGAWCRFRSKSEQVIPGWVLVNVATSRTVRG